VTRSGPDDGGEGAEPIETAVREIERYLRAHPNASDTRQGVRDWWLADLASPLSADVIQIALDRLVDEGKLEARSIPGDVVYGRVRPRDEE
jgi:hypothetical protein